MPAKVVDASAICALLFGEPEAASIAGQLEGAALAAPALLSFEVANVCLLKIGRHPRRRNALLKAHGLLQAMDIDMPGIDYRAALLLAEKTRLTVYDASYLWLALALDAELVTLDKRLATAHSSTRRK